jgi:hypothetical protein
MSPASLGGWLVLGTGDGSPLRLGRDDASRAAKNELSKRIYHVADPPLAYRIMQAIWHWFARQLDHAATAAPGGATGLVLIVVALVALALVIRWRVGPLARSARSERALFDDTPLDAADHRRAAEAFAAAGNYAEAIRERVRAIVRELEQRGLLDPRPGRTADEAAAEAAGVVPDAAALLREAVRVFDDVWYGGRDATAEQDAMVRAADERVRTGALVSAR